MDVYVQFWAPFPSSSFCLKAQQVLEEAALCAWRGAVARLHVCSREMEPGWKVKPSQMEVLLNTPSSPSLKSSVFFVKLSCYSSSLENVSPVLFSAVTSNRWWFAARAGPAHGALLLLGSDSFVPDFDEGVSPWSDKCQCHLGSPGPSQCCWPQIALLPQTWAGLVYLSAHRVPFTTVSAVWLEKETWSGVACFSSGSHFSLSLVILKHTSENC